MVIGAKVNGHEFRRPFIEHRRIRRLTRRFEVVAATHSVTELKGMFGKTAKRVSIEGMNKAIAARGASAR